jgi:hypothetical protein
MKELESEIWDTVHRHLQSIFARDVDTYVATTAEDLSLYEWFVTPHRQDGLPFHLFMIEHTWADTAAGSRASSCTGARRLSATRSCSASPRRAASATAATMKAGC